MIESFRAGLDAFFAFILLIILGAIALVAAIAFGFGAQSVARDIVERAYERRGEVTSGGTDGHEGGEFGTDRPSAYPLRREEWLPRSRYSREDAPRVPSLLIARLLTTLLTTFRSPVGAAKGSCGWSTSVALRSAALSFS